MIPINDPLRTICQEQELPDLFNRVIESGKWILGPEHDAFERELANFIGARFAHGVANGTDALEIALRAVGCAVGSNVISVANAGGYASIAANAIGCKVIYCDVDPIRLVMDVDSLKRLLSKDITAVVVTHLFGNVAPIGEIVDMCRPLGISVIEDCAQAIGSMLNGIRVGSIGDVGTFSFYPTKNLAAIGDAGAVTTSNEEISQKILMLRQYGWVEKYKVESSGGMNSRLDELQAAILRVRLLKLESNNKLRRRILNAYEIELAETSTRLVTRSDLNASPHLAVLYFCSREARQNFRQGFHDIGIQTDIHYPLLDSDQPGFDSQWRLSDLPNSRESVERILTIPLFPGLNEEELGLICGAIKSYS